MGTMKHYAMVTDELVGAFALSAEELLPDIEDWRHERLRRFAKAAVEAAFIEGCAMVRRQVAGKSTYGDLP